MRSPERFTAHTCPIEFSAETGYCILQVDGVLPTHRHAGLSPRAGGDVAPCVEEAIDRFNEVVDFRVADRQRQRHESAPRHVDAAAKHVEEEETLEVCVAVRGVDGRTNETFGRVRG